eukprot:5567990-Amphidinium_carterae.1
MYANHRGMNVEYSQVPLWRTVTHGNYPVRPGKMVEDHLMKIRKETLKVKEDVLAVALRLKEEYWSFENGRNLRRIQEKAKGVLKQQHAAPKSVKLSQTGKLPAEDFRKPVLEKINRAMKNLQETNTNGIVLLSGGTGTGKYVFPGPVSGYDC